MRTCDKRHVLKASHCICTHDKGSVLTARVSTSVLMTKSVFVVTARVSTCVFMTKSVFVLTTRVIAFVLMTKEVYLIVLTAIESVHLYLYS